MKIGAIATLVGLAGAAVASSAAVAAPHTAHDAAACTPSIKTVGGHTVIGYCGPAAATLTIGRRTYSFKGGTCQKDTAANQTLSLTLGSIAAGVSGNDKLALFMLQIVTDGSLKIETVSADWAGKQVASADPVSMKWKGSIPSSGTFTSTKSALSGPVAFSGSWNCKGPLVPVA
jgi:hypothetical protein